MPDFSILLGSPRLDIAAAGGPSVKKRPPDDDPDAIRRIQHALVELGFPLPKSFPGGASGEPDGLFGPETFNAVHAFQKREFPGQYGQWDGRVGKNTLAKMSAKRSEEHTSELQSLMRHSYAVFCLEKKIIHKQTKRKHRYPSNNK